MIRKINKKIAFIGKSALMALALSGAALAAPAAPASKADFNHMTTGYPLHGAHAIAACETCHVGGVFKGTPKDCDGCHTVGRRVVATPKSTAHVVTNAACDTCHFNTASFLGARFNHGMAKSGSCTTCHNSRTSAGRPAAHNAGKKLTESCDSCHRTYAWIPASWNHVGVIPGTCTTCHNGSDAPGKPGDHTTFAKATYQCDDCHSLIGWIPAAYKHKASATGTCDGCHNTSIALGEPVSTHGPAPYVLRAEKQCDDCHTTRGWSPATFKHNTGESCFSCHNGTRAPGKSANHGYVGTAECNTCHHNTTTWLGASYHNGTVTGICGTCHTGANGIKGVLNDPNGTHIPLTAGGNPNCDLCHTSQTTFTAHTMRHTGISTCNTCHLTGSLFVVTTKRQLGSTHNGSTLDQDCSHCHTSTSTWSGALGTKPSNHIPYNGGVACNSCHDSAMSGSAMHANVSTLACKTCHDSNSPSYLGVSGKRALNHEKSNTTAQDCISSGCHSRRFSGW